MAAQRQPELLLVEDDASTRKLLANLMRKFGFRVTEAATAAAAGRSLAEGLEVVVLDLMLPDGNGSDVLQMIRARALTPLVAIVTAVEDRDALDRAVALKPDAFFGKPLDVADFANWLRETRFAASLKLEIAEA
jgi:two-component system, OmpR family, response regulator